MGCWNGTCCVTNLPIFCGDPVIGLLLFHLPNKNSEGTIVSNIASPFYFEGEYNDYGAIEAEHGVALPLIMEKIKETLLEMEQGENQYHEKEISKDKFDFEMLMDEMHEQRIIVENKHISWMYERASVTLLMIRKPVFEEIIETISINTYDKEHPVVTYDYAADSINMFIDSMINDVSMFGNMLTGHKGGIVGNMLLNWEKAHCPAIDLKHTLLQLVANEKIIEPEYREYVWKIVDNALRVKFLTSYMEQLHKRLDTPGYAGQDGITDIHEHFASMIIEESEKIQNRWDEEEE